ncbi:MAG: hypothetical protein IPH28_16885 [Cytophagaceae bacterium]|nr:hypothetical protein [Cytophagaceae bacterium]MBK9510197.1 hypothetical protein [Cytophagaceae bacterium]MBK9934779.1 hypothetical protein [Cytophagaceae bacterium]MBL0301218.1 hypothetical protein [Cytophagaceae bacterium]MBL0324035.1 hypothetical protein [Cytophagaceae bacterium]
MITVSIKSKGLSSPKAISLAKKLLKSKNDLLEEIKLDGQNPAFIEKIDELRKKNAK